MAIFQKDFYINTPGETIEGNINGDIWKQCTKGNDYWPIDFRNLTYLCSDICYSDSISGNYKSF